MSAQSKTALNSTIDAQITTNGSNDITGAQLNAILGNMVDSYEDFVGSYTTAQIAALTGMTLRQRVFNTTDNDYEYYDGTRWVKEAHPHYKVYTALLTQTGTNAPVATVLENTLGGTVVWSYDDVGRYNATYTGVGNGKVLISHGALIGVFSCGWDKITDDILLLTTSSLDSVNPSYLENAILNHALIEIRVFY